MLLDQQVFSDSVNLPFLATFTNYLSDDFICRNRVATERAIELKFKGMDLKQLCYPNSKRLNPELVDYHYSVLEQKKMTYQLDPSLTPMHLKMGPHYLKNVPLENLNLVADYSDAAGTSSSRSTTPIPEAEIASTKSEIPAGPYKEED